MTKEKILLRAIRDRRFTSWRYTAHFTIINLYTSALFWTFHQLHQILLYLTTLFFFSFIPSLFLLPKCQVLHFPPLSFFLLPEYWALYFTTSPLYFSFPKVRSFFYLPFSSTQILSSPFLTPYILFLLNNSPLFYPEQNIYISLSLNTILSSKLSISPSQILNHLLQFPKTFFLFSHSEQFTFKSE